MSLEKKLRQAATAAALEAVSNERARCLWVLDKIVSETRAKLSGKLLSETQLHSARVKLTIAEGVVSMARRAIVSGARPPGGPGTPSAAVLSAEALLLELEDLRQWNERVFAGDLQLEDELQHRIKVIEDAKRQDTVDR